MPATKVYNIVANESLSIFYDEIEEHFCDKNSEFGRNMDALNDLLTGGFGFLYDDKQNKVDTTIIVHKSHLLSPKMRLLFARAMEESAEYYDSSGLYSHTYNWLTITLA